MKRELLVGANTTKNYGVMDLQKPFFGWDIN
jgi:hypothetical protein